MRDEFAESIELMKRLGHVEYVPEDAHLPESQRRLRLTPLGETYAEAIGVTYQEEDENDG